MHIKTFTLGTLSSFESGKGLLSPIEQDHGGADLEKYCFWINYTSAMIIFVLFRIISYWMKLFRVIEELHGQLDQLATAICEQVQCSIDDATTLLELWREIVSWMLEAPKTGDEIIEVLSSYLGTTIIPNIPTNSSLFDKVRKISEDPLIQKEFESLITPLRYTFYVICSIIVLILIGFNIYRWRKSRPPQAEQRPDTRRHGYLTAALSHQDSWRCMQLGCIGLVSFLVEILAVIWCKQRVSKIQDMVQAGLKTDISPIWESAKSKIIPFMEELIDHIRMTATGIPCTRLLSIMKSSLGRKLLTLNQPFALDMNQLIDQLFSSILKKDLNWNRPDLWLFLGLIVYGTLVILIGLALCFKKRTDQ